MKKIFYLFILTFTTIGAFTDALAAKFIDQMQPILDDSLTLAIGGSSEQKLAQTITVGQDAILKGVYLPISCDTGKLKIEIRDVIGGMPGETILASKKISAMKFSHVASSFRYFGLRGNLPLLTGDQISIVLSNSTGSCGIVKGAVGNSYDMGNGFFDALPNAPGWEPFFSVNAALDLAFMTVIKAP